MSRGNPLPVDAVLAFREMAGENAMLSVLLERYRDGAPFGRPHALRLLAAKALALAGENELFAAVVNVAQAKQEQETVAK